MMGSLSIHYDPYAYQNGFRGFLEHEFAPHSLVDYSVVKRRTVYAAVRLNGVDADAGRVVAFIILLQWSGGYHNLTYKVMDESAGPVADQCPERILKALSPLEDFVSDMGYAHEWRERVAASHAARKARPKVRPGDVVEFAEPLEFGSSAWSAQRFVWVTDSIFKAFPDQSDLLYHQRFYGVGVRIPNWRTLPYTVVGTDLAALG